MKSLILNIKNSLPYILLIVIYFFFINIEAQKDQKNNKFNKIKKEVNVKKSYSKDNNLRIPIQVVPYNK